MERQPTVGARYQVTGRRGHAKRYYGAIGVCEHVDINEGRGNLSMRYWIIRIALRTDDGRMIAWIPATQVTEVNGGEL